MVLLWTLEGRRAGSWGFDGVVRVEWNTSFGTDERAGPERGTGTTQAVGVLE